MSVTDTESTPLLHQQATLHLHDVTSPQHANNEHNDPHNVQITSADDKNLSSVYLFWDVLWLCVAELVFLCGMLLCEFAVEYHDHEEEHHGGGGEHSGGEHLQQKYTQQFQQLSSEHGPYPPENGREELFMTLNFVLYLLPSGLVLFASILLCLGRRKSVWIRTVHKYIVVLAMLTGLGGFGVAIQRYTMNFDQKDCEEFEGWTVSTLRTLFVVLTLCPFFFRASHIHECVRDAQIQNTRTPKSLISDFAEPSDSLKSWECFVKVLDATITACCMPRVDSCQKASEHERHIYQHIIQLVYEIILFIVAIVEVKYIELVAIVAGMLGSVFGLLSMYMCDVILNMFATIMGTFLFANSMSHATNCSPDIGEGSSLQMWMYLILFSVIANTIRLKSLLHGYVEARESVHDWLLKQVDWICGAHSANFEQQKFGDVKNFYKSVRGGGSKHKHKEEAESKTTPKKTEQKTSESESTNKTSHA